MSNSVVGSWIREEGVDSGGKYLYLSIGKGWERRRQMEDAIQSGQLFFLQTQPKTMQRRDKPQH